MVLGPGLHVRCATYHQDLVSLDYGDVHDMLILIRGRRNSFVHGNPRSIDDGLVGRVVGFLEREHKAWIAVYNYRIASSESLAQGFLRAALVA